MFFVKYLRFQQLQFDVGKLYEGIRSIKLDPPGKIFYFEEKLLKCVSVCYENDKQLCFCETFLTLVVFSNDNAESMPWSL